MNLGIMNAFTKWTQKLYLFTYTVWGGLRCVAGETVPQTVAKLLANRCNPYSQIKNIHVWVSSSGVTDRG